MNRITAKYSGFTLIELMIAISILTLLLFLGSYTYSMMSQRWNKELGQFNQSAATLKNLDALQRALEGISPLVIIDKQQRPSFFFIGSKDSLLSITQAGIFNEKYPEIFRLTAVENKEGLYSLIYQAISTKTIMLKEVDQQINFTRQLTLFKNLTAITFNYYGWKSLYEKSEAAHNETANWSDKFSGIDSQLLPEKFSITLDKKGKKLSFPIILDTEVERWLSPYMTDDE